MTYVVTLSVYVEGGYVYGGEKVVGAFRDKTAAIAFGKNFLKDYTAYYQATHTDGVDEQSRVTIQAFGDNGLPSYKFALVRETVIAEKEIKEDETWLWRVC